MLRRTTTNEALRIPQRLWRRAVAGAQRGRRVPAMPVSTLRAATTLRTMHDAAVLRSTQGPMARRMFASSAAGPEAFFDKYAAHVAERAAQRGGPAAGRCREGEHHVPGRGARRV